MKIILHLGQSKTGTTALQMSLNKASDRLRAKKVLYPRSGYVFYAHHLLLALCGLEDRFSGWRLAQLGGAANAARAARQAWETTCQEVRRDPPEVLVLSTEYIINRTNAAQKARLASILSELSDDITPVIYVREPVDHYRARLQEWIKRNDQPYPPKDTALKQVILDLEAAFGRPPELVYFDRKALIGGDTVVDFVTRYLAPWVDPADVPSLSANTGLSAEASVLVSRKRMEGERLDASPSGERVFSLLRALDSQDPPDRFFALLPEVADAALHTATSYRWLAETGRLTIPGLKIEEIDGAPTPEWMTTARPADLFRHDPERLERLSRALDRIVAEGGLASGAPGGAKPRGRDRLLRFLLGRLKSDPAETKTASFRKE